MKSIIKWILTMLAIFGTVFAATVVGLKYAKTKDQPARIISSPKTSQSNATGSVVNSKSDNEVTAYSSPTATQSDNYGVLSKIVSDYHKAHTYIGKQNGADDDIYVCGDMACDVWDMVQKAGINAKVAIGNVDADIKSFRDANHAWVLAETTPGNWLALEATGGFVVNGAENKRYYNHAHGFPTPKEFREYIEIIHQRNAAIAKCKESQNTSQLAYNDYMQAYKAYEKAYLDFKQVADLMPYANGSDLAKLEIIFKQKKKFMDELDILVEQAKVVMEQKSIVFNQRKSDLSEINQKLDILFSKK